MIIVQFNNLLTIFLTLNDFRKSICSFNLKLLSEFKIKRKQVEILILLKFKSSRGDVVRNSNLNCQTVKARLIAVECYVNF